ncbi:hypothetical protein P3X46_023725 [Hevea brasiliensis]|uniref:BHLH domain-containing protein n=1 Tax=Hevea brasiliensis TaxID=3981 RepID=A0ABQ9LBW4_HEVBR|nr:transcription factor bHLH36 isoform X2 [Hevea brasiliensis]KAJ9164111.1 hypothetical protein P3X46_023725 [Hevea brasiliensis]
MFPFQQSNEFSSAISCNPHQDNPFLAGASNNPTNLMGDGLPPRVLANSNTNNDANLACDEKKIIRKEIERQRRQQMSTLHASLRSLLPLESLKGKRSMSDHIDEAAKYIKHLQNNVQELSVKRDELKNLSNSTPLDDQRNEISSYNNLMSTTVTVLSRVDGVEIVANSGYGEDSFLLSRVLDAIIEEGFEVICCISTKRDGRLYNTIQCQASHLPCMDVAALQQKLNNVILSSRFTSN